MADSELLLEKYQNKSLSSATVLFIESSMHGFTNAFKAPENTQCKLVLRKVNFGSKFV